MNDRNTLYSLAVLLFFMVGNVQAQASYKIVNYHITVKLSEIYDRFEIRARLDVKNIKECEQKTMEIMLGRNFGGAKIDNIKILDENFHRNLDYVQNNDSLIIKLPDSFTDGRIIISYDVLEDTTFRDQYANFSFLISDSLNHINAAITRTDNWFPKIEGTVAERLPPFSLEIDVPAKFEVMASGKLTKVYEEQGRKTYQWQNYDSITDRSLYFFAAERKKIIKEFSDGFKVIMYLPFQVIDSNVTFIAEVIHKTYRYFEKIYGPVPGNEYKIMAFPYDYSGLFNSMTAPVSLFTAEIRHNEIYYPTRTLLHEISHTWWGNLVSSNAEENYWLYEGFAKYSEIIGLKPVLGVDVDSLSFFRLKLCTLPYLDYVRSIVEAGKDENQFLKMTSAYHMGATYLKLLEYILGKENFFRAIRKYVRTFRGRSIATEDFIRIMQQNCPRKFSALFADYLYNPGYAKYLIIQKEIKQRKGYFIHCYEIKNIGDKDICSEMQVKSDKESYTGRLWLEKGKTITVDVKSSSQNDSALIVIDPREVLPVWPSGYRCLGGMVYRNDKNEIIFFNIIEKCPLAAAGIKNGMHMLSVDGENLAEKDLRSLNYLLIRPIGTKLKLLVKEQQPSPIEVIVSY